VLVACLTLFAGAGGQAVADMHRVELKKDLQQEDKASFGAKEQKKALARAVMREADQILAGSLPEGRKEVLRELMRGKTDDFVLSYSEQRYLEDERTGVLSLEVEVNTSAVKGFLKEWGTYYTSAGEWPYRLDVRGELDEEQELRLADLETASGLRRDRGVQEPVFLLRPPGENGGRWKALLKRNGEETPHHAESLDKVWLTAWREYFSARSVRLRVERNMRLTASGWTSSAGVRHFHSSLGGWSARLDRAELVSLEFSPGGVSGIWMVYTLTPEEFRGRLESSMASRGLSYRLEDVNTTRERDNASSRTRRSDVLFTE